MLPFNYLLKLADNINKESFGSSCRQALITSNVQIWSWVVAVHSFRIKRSANNGAIPKRQREKKRKKSWRLQISCNRRQRWKKKKEKKTATTTSRGKHLWLALEFWLVNWIWLISVSLNYKLKRATPQHSVEQSRLRIKWSNLLDEWFGQLQINK